MVSRISSRLLRLPVERIRLVCTHHSVGYHSHSIPACGMPQLNIGHTLPSVNKIQRMRLCTNASPPQQPAEPKPSESSPSNSNNRDEDFSEFFFFPNIRTTRLMVRMKVYQTAMVLMPLPFCLTWFSSGAISATAMYAYSGFALFSITLLVAISYKANGLVGRLALSKDHKIVQISYLDFWGERKEDFVEVQNLVPFAELKDSPTDTLMKLLRYDDKTHYYLCLRNGGIKDQKRFEHVFGKPY